MTGDVPTRNKMEQCPQFQRNMDVRYLKNIKHLKDRIKSTYSCNQQQCPVIKERLDHHQQEHHSTSKIKEFATQGTKTPEHCCNRKPKTLDQGNAVSPAKSKSCMSRKSNTNTKLQSAFSSQADLNIDNSIPTMCNSDKKSANVYLDKKAENGESINEKINNNDVSSRSFDIPVRNTETREVLTPRSNFYLEYVRNEVFKWLQDVPMNPNLDDSGKMLRDNVVNSLICKINELSVDVMDTKYEDSLLFEINTALSELSLPGDQNIFKNKLSLDLLKSIKELNNRVLIDQNENCENLKMCSRDQTIRFSVDEAKHVIENEINEWLTGIEMQQDSNSKPISKKEVVDNLLNSLSPLLNEPNCNTSHRLTIKEEIVKVLDTLPICVKCTRNRTLLLNRFAEELTTRLLSIQARYKPSRCFSNNSVPGCIIQTANNVMCSTSFSNDYKHDLFEEISNYIGSTDIGRNRELEREIVEVIHENSKLIRSGQYVTVSNEICSILRNYSCMHESKVYNITKDLIKRVKNILNENWLQNVPTNTIIQPHLSGIISVYTSEDKLSSNYPITSTPKKPTIPRSEIPKLNAEEIGYMENVAKVVQEWMSTLPTQFNSAEEKGFKETMIYDLAGDVMDEIKKEQISPHNKMEIVIRYTILRWLAKLNMCDGYEQCQKEVDDLYNKINEIPVPILTRPQHGTRKVMENIKFVDEVNESSWAFMDYVPKGMEVLEDEISMWMNEQPNEIYAYEDRSVRNKMVHELAEQLQDKLVNKEPEKIIQHDVAQWLNKVVKPDHKANLPDLIEDLRDRVKKLPQDATLHKQFKERLLERVEKAKLKKLAREKENNQSFNTSNHEDDNDDSEKTMKEFIAKYIQHNYDVDDSVARRALSYLLKQEIRRLSPPTRKEVYDNFTKSQPSAILAPEKFRRELDYIKMISDWLNNLPIIDSAFNTSGNKHRVEFVCNIAKTIVELEDEKRNAPEAMDYEVYLESLIIAYIVQLPISKIQISNMAGLAARLINRISNYQNNIIPRLQKMKQSQEIGDFIEEFIRENGADIEDDQLKLEAWSGRLMKEIRKIVHETSDPSALCKNQVYNRLALIPKPGDESVELFGLELEYVEQISEWLKNLPLLPITNKLEEDKRVRMISELSEKMAERQMQVMANPNNTQIDQNFADYVSNWIQEVPLDPNRPIDFIVILRQLINRMEKVIESKHTNVEPNPPLVQTCAKSCKQNVKSKSFNTKLKQNPGKLTIEAVDKFCNALPIQGDSDAVKVTRDAIAKNIFQKIGELNIDPRIFNDDILYKDMLLDEIDKEIERLPQNAQLQKNTIEKLKTSLIETILEAKNAIAQNSAGENYMRQLENSIESSIPYPINSKQIYDPGFEIYKSRLATKFILDNFDHSNEDVKLKYETRIRAEIDKYFQSALNKNAEPLTKDQMYNELYSSLFKVPIPHETSIADEVEVLKTRCEIDIWFGNLPLREVNGISEQLELDKILSTLATRIHEIEKTEQNPDKKIHNEIAKWVVKLPLSAGNEGKVNEFSNKLVSALRSSAQDRKYVPVKRGKKGKGKKSKPKPKKMGSTKNENVPIQSTSYKNPALTADQVPMAHKKPADVILEIVQAWCHELPLRATTPQEEQIVINMKENLVTKIILKISELNSNPVVFADDILYDQLFDEELEIIMSPLPTCCEFQQSKDLRKSLLKQAIKMVKPLIMEERAKHDYKQDLKNTVVSVLEEPHNKTAENVEEYSNLVEEIVEEFVQYNYNKSDNEGKQVYKMKVHDAVVKYLADVAGQNHPEGQPDPLIIRNKLLCELQKVLEPSKAMIQEEIEEIRMKNEVGEFFDEISIPAQNVTIRNQMKTSLAKRLIDLEQNDHNNANDIKMKSVINRCLKKLNKEVSPEIVDAFVNKLKHNEMVRKAPPPRDARIQEEQDININGHRSHVESQMSAVQLTSSSNVNESGVQWMSLKENKVVPQNDLNFHMPFVIPEFRQSQDDVWYPFGHEVEEERNLGVSATSFPGFGAGIPLSSSVDQQRPFPPAAEELRTSCQAPNPNSIPQPAQIGPQGTPQDLPVAPVAQATADEPCVQTCPNNNAAIEIPQGTPSRGAPLTLRILAPNAPTVGPTFTAHPSEPASEPDQNMRLAIPRAARARRTRTTVSEQSDEDCGECRCRWKKRSRNRPMPCPMSSYFNDFYSDYKPMPFLMSRMPMIRGFFFL